MNTSIPLYYFVMILPLRISWTFLLQNTKNKTTERKMELKSCNEEPKGLVFSLVIFPVLTTLVDNSVISDQ